MNIIKLTVLLVCAASLQLPQKANAVNVPSPRELFNRVEERFTAITSLSYTVKRSASSNQQVAKDRWLFRFKSPDKIRIDYLEPYSRLIVTDSTTLMEYLPTARKAIKTNLAAIAPEDREKFLIGVFKRVSVDGLRLGNYQEMLQRAVKVSDVNLGERRAWLVEGRNPSYLLFIDQEKSVLLKTEIYDADGQLILRTESTELFELAPGFWFPREIRSSTRASAGFYKTTVKLSDIKVNEVTADQTFQFYPPAGVDITISK